MAKREPSKTTSPVLSAQEVSIESLFEKCPDALWRASKATQSILSNWGLRDYYTQYQPHRAGEYMFVASLLRGIVRMVFSLKRDVLLRALNYQNTITDIDLPILTQPIHEETAHLAAGMFVYDVTSNAERETFQRLAGATVNGVPIETFKGILSWCNVSDDWEVFARDVWEQMPETHRSYFAKEESRIPVRECNDLEIRLRHEWARYQVAVDLQNDTNPRTGAITTTLKRVDNPRELNRIIELSAKWQEPFWWTQAFKAADDFRKYRELGNTFAAININNLRQRDKLQASLEDQRLPEDERQQIENELCNAQKMVTDEMWEIPHASAERYGALSDECHKQAIDAHQELLDLKNLVRQHAPTLLEFVPDVNFFNDPADANHYPQLRDVKRLEGQARVLLQEKPLGQHEAAIQGAEEDRGIAPKRDDETDWSMPRKKADWISLSRTSKRKLTDNGWDSFRESHSDRIKQKEPGSRSWLFARSLCVEFSFPCPEFNK